MVSLTGLLVPLRASAYFSVHGKTIAYHHQKIVFYTFWQTYRTRLQALGVSVDSLRADKEFAHKRDSTHHSTDCRDKKAGC